MEQITLDPQYTQWDVYKRFHAPLGRYGYGSSSYAPALVFESGEMVMLKHALSKPENRGYWRLPNVAPCLSTDSFCPNLVWRDRPVPTAWLDCSGAQQLMIDYDMHAVVGAMSDTQVKKDMRIPKWIREKFPRLAVYWSGPDALPVGGEVRLSMPARNYYSKSDMARFKELFVAAKAVYELQRRPEDASPTRALTPNVLENIAGVDELSDYQLRCLAKSGIDRKIVHVPYLAIEGHDVSEAVRKGWE